MIVILLLFRAVRGVTRHREALVGQPLTFDVTDTAVAVTNGPEQVVRQWAAFDRFAESTGLLLLRVKTSGDWLALPKRALTEPAHSAAVRALFEAVTDPVSPGFPVLPV